MHSQPNRCDNSGEGVQKSLLSHDLLRGQATLCSAASRQGGVGQKCGLGQRQRFEIKSVKGGRNYWVISQDKISSVFYPSSSHAPQWPYLVQSLKSSLQASCCSRVVHSAVISSSSSGMCSSD